MNSLTVIVTPVTTKARLQSISSMPHVILSSGVANTHYNWPRSWVNESLGIQYCPLFAVSHEDLY